MSQAAVRAAPLITAEYLEMQRKLHENPRYGVASITYAPLVAQVVEACAATEILDYGAGKGRLGVALRDHLRRPDSVFTAHDSATGDRNAKTKAR